MMPEKPSTSVENTERQLSHPTPSAGETESSQVERPVARIPEKIDWTDDDIAAMSLSGCISTVVLVLVWMRVYLGGLSLVDYAMREGERGETSWIMIGTMAASVIALVGSGYVFGVRKHPQGWRAIDLRPTTRRWLLFAALLGVLFIPVNALVSSTVGAALDMPTTLPETVQDGSFPVVEFLAVFFMTAIVVPIGEEIFFRGIIYRWLRDHAGFPMGLVVSSIAFGALHLAPPSVVAISIMGALCALVYEWSGSLWPAVMIHSVNNGIVVIISYVLYASPWAV